MEISSLQLTNLFQAEQAAISNVIQPLRVDAVILEDTRHPETFTARFAYTTLMKWECAVRSRNAMYYQFRLVQVLEPAEYDGLPQVSQECPHSITPRSDERTSSRNRLRVDSIHTDSDRCLLQTPEHWPPMASALRWIGSGGGAGVFGYCHGRQHHLCPLNAQ